MSERYQTGLGVQGVFDTAAWYDALRKGIDGPLGDVIDIGCAEGVMCALAVADGAERVVGIDLDAERIATARATVPGATFAVADATTYDGEYWRTVICSQIIHWLGKEAAVRWFRKASRNLAVVFRLANDHYEIPGHGTWFPTFEELDAAVGGVRTSETHLLTQDHDKQIWSATYRTDLRVTDGIVYKRGRATTPLYRGFDLLGDLPFRPTQGRAVMRLSGQNADAVRALARYVACEALQDGTYPSDFSPRNVIVDGAVAYLIDDEPDERAPGPVVAPEYLPIWRATLSSIGLAFDGNLRDLL